MKGPEIPDGWLHQDALSYRAITIATSVERVTKKVRLGGGFFAQPEFAQPEFEEDDDDEDDGINEDDDAVLFFGRPDDETGIVNDWS